MMFSYYGSKSKIAHLYPQPKFPLIIEPFCGSAQYALLYHTHQVLVNDYEPMIADIWRWLIGLKAVEIDALPDLVPGDDLRNFTLSRQARNYLGFCVQRGLTHPGNIYCGWAVKDKMHERLKPRLHETCNRLQHWQVSNLDYRALPDVEATWFIDPPYQNYKDYRHYGMDYGVLGDWCKSRRGQVIVCESGLADWLPFKLLSGNFGRGTCDECIWTNE